METIRCKKIVVIAGLIFQCLIACNKEDDSVSMEEQKIFFEFNSTNSAWGLAYTHWIIDNKGNIRVNRVRDSIVNISADRLGSFVNYFDSIIYKLETKELTKYVGMIDFAAKGDIDSISRTKNDFGSVLVNCFWYDKISKRYKTILLSFKSDLLDCKNTDTSAIKIDSWLKDINSNIYPKRGIRELL